MNSKNGFTYKPEHTGSGQFGVCDNCGKPPTEEGHDGCLGTLKGDVMNDLLTLEQQQELINQNKELRNRLGSVDYWGTKVFKGVCGRWFLPSIELRFKHKDGTEDMVYILSEEQINESIIELKHEGYEFISRDMIFTELTQW